MIILMLGANPYLTPQEKEIIQLWEETIKEWRNLTKPFSIPRAVERSKEIWKRYYEYREKVLKSLKANRFGDYDIARSKCSADCDRGSCSISCRTKWSYCGCPSGDPICFCDPAPFSTEVKEDKTYQKSYKGFYTIYDLSGRVVFSGNLSGKLPPLKRGVYFLKDRSKNISKVVIR